MSTESRLQSRCPTGKLQYPSGCEGGKEEEGVQQHLRGRHHVALCGSVSGQNWLLFCFFTSSACMASNGILIVYIARAAPQSTVTVISSPLPSSFSVSSISFHFPVPPTLLSTLLVFLHLLPLFSPSLHSLLFPPPLLLSCLKGWMMASLEPQQGSAAQKAACHPVPRSCWVAILYFMSRWSAISSNMAPC